MNEHVQHMKKTTHFTGSHILHGLCHMASPDLHLGQLRRLPLWRAEYDLEMAKDFFLYIFE